MYANKGDVKHDAGTMPKNEAHEEISDLLFEDLDEILSYELLTKKFGEIENLCDNPEEYPRHKEEPGTLVIFNQTFKYSSEYTPRIGTEADVNELLKSFGRLGFNINRNYISSDLDRTDTIAKIKEIANDEALARVNCLVVVFLTHGDEGDKLATFNGDLLVSELVEDFAKSKHLIGKPKLFLIQACKGEKITDNRRNEDVVDTAQQTPLVTEDTFIAHQYPDVIKVYSTVEGKVCYRHSSDGSWLIQEFCRNMTAFGRMEDVVSLLTRTFKCIASVYYKIKIEATEGHVNEEIHKQMPIFVSTLKKEFYLTRSYNRNFLLLQRKATELALRRADETLVMLKNIK